MLKKSFLRKGDRRVAKKDNQKNHYVDNAKFLEALIEYKKEVNAAKAEGRPRPQIPDYIGSCFLQIANKISYTGLFGYFHAYREEFLGDAAENCCQYIDNFDPAISKHPFAYFTQIISFAFMRRIKKEGKHTYIKYKSIEASKLYDTEEFMHYLQKSKLLTPERREFISKFESFMAKSKQDKKEKQAAKNSLQQLLSESDENKDDEQ